MKPNKPVQPVPSNGNGSAGNPTQPSIPVPPQQPSTPAQPQKVSQGYLDLLKNTYHSRGSIQTYIQNAMKRRHFTSAEANALNDFVANAQNLNSLPDVKVLNADQKAVLGNINRMVKQVRAALNQYKAYDEQQRIPQPHQQQQQEEDPGRGVNHTNDPIEDPIYQQV